MIEYLKGALFSMVNVNVYTYIIVYNRIYVCFNYLCAEVYR